ncbi:AAEL007166-PA [Aedes aegypti]|uniref:AAEL007166-PA n=1 Tax=Aedes aegypti TaxID=7159 RepID=Q173G9_AEDAE|nr:AAEL007166-PA [Aedes aegypti]
MKNSVSPSFKGSDHSSCTSNAAFDFVFLGSAFGALCVTTSTFFGKSCFGSATTFDDFLTTFDSCFCCFMAASFDSLLTFNFLSFSSFICALDTFFRVFFLESDFVAGFGSEFSGFSSVSVQTFNSSILGFFSVVCCCFNFANSFRFFFLGIFSPTTSSW